MKGYLFCLIFNFLGDLYKVLYILYGMTVQVLLSVKITGK